MSGVCGRAPDNIFEQLRRTTTDDIQLLITFALDLYSGMTDVVFSRNVDSDSFSGQSWSTKKTGEGEQFKIFSTVKNVIEDFVKKYESERGERDMPIGAIRFIALIKIKGVVKIVEPRFIEHGQRNMLDK